MRNIVIGGLAVFGLLAVFLFVNREPLALGYFAGKIEKQSLDAHKSLLADHIQFRAPSQGDAPYPAVIQFHGCSGMRPAFMDHWAKAADEAGYMAVIVDSHAPRGIDGDQARETVCQGKELLGQERVADVIAAMEIVAARDDVDADRIVLAGWSHGAWTLMDLLSLDLANKAPAALSEKVAAPSANGVILFYPYCGIGALSRFNPWRGDAPTLAFVAGEDQIVDGPQCKSMIERKTAKGAPFDLVYYAEQDHIFDDPTLTGDLRHFFDEEAAADAYGKYVDFLQERGR